MASESQSVNATRLAEARRIVLKIGSSLFVDQESGALDRAWLEALCVDVAEMHENGQDVIIVSSGAIALGASQLGMKVARARLAESQAAAAAGQIQLAHAYQEILGGHSINTAQILLTLDDSESRRRYLNAASTLLTLLKCRAVPVVNENDTVATQEIRYGDNDRLAARVAQMVSADCLVLLSDVDGLYTSDPRIRIPVQSPYSRKSRSLRNSTGKWPAVQGRIMAPAGCGRSSMPRASRWGQVAGS